MKLTQQQKYEQLLQAKKTLEREQWLRDLGGRNHPFSTRLINLKLAQVNAKLVLTNKKEEIQ